MKLVSLKLGDHFISVTSKLHPLKYHVVDVAVVCPELSHASVAKHAVSTRKFLPIHAWLLALWARTQLLHHVDLTFDHFEVCLHFYAGERFEADALIKGHCSREGG